MNRELSSSDGGARSWTGTLAGTAPPAETMMLDDDREGDDDGGGVGGGGSVLLEEDSMVMSAGGAAREFISSVKGALEPEEYGDFLADLRALRDSGGNGRGAATLVDGIADFFSAPELQHLLVGFAPFVPLALRADYERRTAATIAESKGLVDAPHEPRTPFPRSLAGVTPLAEAPVQSSIGAQPAGSCIAASGKRSEPAYTIGRSRDGREPMAAIYSFDPEACGNGGFGVRAGAYVGNVSDMPGQRGSEATPGPQNYHTAAAEAAVAPRPSTMRFGREPQRTDRIFISKQHSATSNMEAATTPGAKYAHREACGVQPLSQQRSAPAFSFELAPPTRRCVSVKQQRARRPDAPRTMRSTALLRGLLRSRSSLEGPEPELPSRDDPEMQLMFDFPIKHRLPPSATFSRVDRLSMIGAPSREKLPVSDPAVLRSLMKGTLSPGPIYDVGGIYASQHVAAPALSFGLSGTMRNSYLPPAAQGRRPGGIAELNERVSTVRELTSGTRANMEVPTSIGTQQSSKKKTAPRFSVSRSRRVHHSERSSWCAETVTHNRRAISDISVKYSRK